MTDTPPDEDWGRLARYVEQRMSALHLDAPDVSRRGGPSIATVSKLRNGKSTDYHASTLAKLEEALDWTSGDVARILRGHEPTPTNRQGTQLATAIAVERTAGTIYTIHLPDGTPVMAWAPGGLDAQREAQVRAFFEARRAG